MREAKLIDGVRDRFISDLLEHKQFAKHKRSFTLHTEEIKPLLEEFLLEELTLFAKKNMRGREDFVRGYLHEYLFSAIEEDYFLRSYGITKEELDVNYSAVRRGFKELYEDDLM